MNNASFPIVSDLASCARVSVMVILPEEPFLNNFLDTMSTMPFSLGMGEPLIGGERHFGDIFALSFLENELSVPILKGDWYEDLSRPSLLSKRERSLDTAIALANSSVPAKSIKNQQLK